MNVSRRKFLATFSTSVAAVCLTAGTASAARGLGSNLRQGATSLAGRGGHGKLTWNSIYPYLETDFEFSTLDRSAASETVRLRLVGLSNTDKAAQAFEREPQSFVLAFDTWADDGRAVLSQGTYAVKHFALGKFELFISEGSLESDKHLYTAVINRVIG